VQPNHNFIKQVVPHLVPVLLQQLTKQEEGQEQDDTAWNMAMASGTCLGLLSRTAQVSTKPGFGDACLSLCAYVCCCECQPWMHLQSARVSMPTCPAPRTQSLPRQDDIVPSVMPFVTENISKASRPEDWRLREAATFAFGSMLEGPDPRTVADIVRQAMGVLLAVSAPRARARVCVCARGCWPRGWSSKGGAWWRGHGTQHKQTHTLQRVLGAAATAGHEGPAPVCARHHGVDHRARV
jgi:importin subunit beta-1